MKLNYRGVMNTRRNFRVNKCEESDGSAGRKPSTICCLVPAVPPFSASLLSLFFPRFRPTKCPRIESIYCQISGDTRHRQDKSKPSPNLILFSRCYFFSLLFPFECAAMQISRRHANEYIQIHTWAHCVWKGFFNGIWRFQFPLCHQRQKTLWAQLPLSHTLPDRTTHTHS